MKPNLPSKKKCCGCGVCSAICPVSAIVLKPDEEGFLQPIIDPKRCVHCGKCERTCPILSSKKARTPLGTFAAKAKDDQLRRGSASGGIFTVLALETLKQGGVVFGAGFDHSDWRVIHKIATNEQELDDLRGSKYVQSDMGNSYAEAKRYLNDGRRVLFSGCPCQIAALKNYLGKEYPNLLTVDLICHGVPSPLAWRKYLDDREKIECGRITQIFARRYCSWNDFSCSLEIITDSGQQKSSGNQGSEDLFIRCFFSYYFLRPACHHCAFRKFRNSSDITIGDYMNVDKELPGYGDDHGVSMFLINTEKGIAEIGLLSDRLDQKKINLHIAAHENYPLVKNPKQSRLRSLFLKELSNNSFSAVVDDMAKHRRTSLFIHLLWWAKRLVINHELNRICWK